ncbi:MAG: hypothetical protein ABSD68_02920 [Candidatus Micrarchaeales archaeon]|jgi:hypothetical protein
MSQIDNAKERGYLTSRIQISAELAGRMSSLKGCLDAYPGLKLIGEGTSLLYKLAEEETSDRFYFIELGKRHITLTIRSKQTPVMFMQEAMLRLLAVAQITSKHYRLDISSLYPYLIIAIASQQIRSLIGVGREAKEDDSDLILSKRLISVMKENATVREGSERLAIRFRKLAQRAIVLSSTGNTSIADLEGNLCLSRDEITEALSDIRHIGYNSVYLGKDRFSLVRT